LPSANINLIKGDKASIETDYRDALPVNMYAVAKNILGAKGYMLCYPGLTAFGTGVGIDRGANYNERFGRQFRVSGNQLMEVFQEGTTSILGTIPGGLQAAMPYSFNTQAIIANGNMFLYSPDGGFSQITDPDLGRPIDGVWVDGYYFLTDGEYIYHTDLNDESSIDPLKFATAEFMPDKSLGVSKTQDNKVMVWGRYSLEYFVDIAQTNFAFQRVETRAQKIGIVATHAKCESAGRWYITGGRKEDAVGVYAVSVGSAAKVSTREIDKIIAEYTEPELSDMRMECRNEDDTTFILVHLPEITLCFNESIAKVFGVEAAWTILKTDIQGDDTYRGINGVFDARIAKFIYGDKRDARIAELDNTVFTHYGDAIEWLLYTPLLKLETASVDQIEIETLPGNAPDGDATVAISETSDGIAYSQEWWDLYGNNLDYNQNFTIYRVGYVADWVGYKLRGATKSRMAFAGFKITYG
jgi:hypothetical protein